MRAESSTPARWPSPRCAAAAEAFLAGDKGTAATGWAAALVFLATAGGKAATAAALTFDRVLPAMGEGATSLNSATK